MTDYTASPCSELQRYSLDVQIQSFARMALWERCPPRPITVCLCFYTVVCPYFTRSIIRLARRVLGNIAFGFRQKEKAALGPRAIMTWPH